MKKRIKAIILAACMFVTTLGFSTTASASDFAGGAGTVLDPYIIETEQQLRKMSSYLTSHFKLANDITLTQYWEPVGRSPAVYGAAAPFSGSLDGDNYTIYNMIVFSNAFETIANLCYGLFGVTNNAVIKNLHLKNGAISGSARWHAGSIVGYAMGSLMIDNCSSDIIMDKIDAHQTGGLVGYADGNNVTILNCTFSGIINAITDSNSGNSVGGIIGFGEATNSLIENCRVIRSPHAENALYSLTGFSNATFTVGGIAGKYMGTISKCYTDVNIYATKNAGGIVGGLANTSGTLVIKDSYSTGNITSRRGSTGIGGIVGVIDSEFPYNAQTYVVRHQIINCYSTSELHYRLKSRQDNDHSGAVYGGTQIGGIIGKDSWITSITDTYALNRGIGSSLHLSTRNVGKFSGWSIIANGGGTCYAIDVPIYSYRAAPVNGILNVGTPYSFSSSANLTGPRAGYDGVRITLDDAKQQSTYKNWDFNNVWIMDPDISDYPILRHFYESGGYTAVTPPGGNTETSKALSVILEIGETLRLGGVIGIGAQTDISGYTWSSSSSSVASVNQDGKVTAVSAGTTKITAVSPTGDEMYLYVTVESLNLQYISDMNWLYSTSGADHEGYPLQLDKNLIGDKITLNGIEYNKGIGTSSFDDNNIPADIAIDISGLGYNRFSSIVGVDDAKIGSAGATAVFQVYGDGILITETPVMTAGDIAWSIDCDITDVDVLVLRVMNAGDGYNYDWANWADAKVYIL